MPLIANIVWNRAASGGGEQPRPGDKHLAALLRYHGVAMNGGVLHATECCLGSTLRNAKLGYQYFGLQGVVALVTRSEALLKLSELPDDVERELNAEYARIAADHKVSKQFEEVFALRPDEFAPVH